MKASVTFLLSIILLGTSFAQEKINSTDFTELSALIEKEFNKTNTLTAANTANYSVVLNFDSIGYFVLLDSTAYHQKEGFAISKLLKEFDQKTGLISQNPLFADTSLIYNLITLVDTELQRTWFTRVWTKPKIKDFRFDNNNGILSPQPPGGVLNLLRYLMTNIKNKNLEHYLSLDTSWISFIIVEDGSVIDVKVNGKINADVQALLDDFGKWTPAVRYGRPFHTLFKIQINENIEEALSRDYLILNIPYKGYLLVSEDLNQERRNNDDRLIISFIYKKGLTEILGPLTIKGSKREGRKLLKLINKHLVQSTMEYFPGPSRFYIIADENKVPSWPSF